MALQDLDWTPPDVKHKLIQLKTTKFGIGMSILQNLATGIETGA